jgi:hypothetical protein
VLDLDSDVVVVPETPTRTAQVLDMDAEDKAAGRIVSSGEVITIQSSASNTQEGTVRHACRDNDNGDHDDNDDNGDERDVVVPASAPRAIAARQTKRSAKLVFTPKPNRSSNKAQTHAHASAETEGGTVAVCTIGAEDADHDDATCRGRGVRPSSKSTSNKSTSNKSTSKTTAVMPLTRVTRSSPPAFEQYVRWLYYCSLF